MARLFPFLSKSPAAATGAPSPAVLGNVRKNVNNKNLATALGQYVTSIRRLRGINNGRLTKNALRNATAANSKLVSAAIQNYVMAVNKAQYANAAAAAALGAVASGEASESEAVPAVKQAATQTENVTAAKQVLTSTVNNTNKLLIEYAKGLANKNNNAMNALGIGNVKGRNAAAQKRAEINKLLKNQSKVVSNTNRQNLTKAINRINAYLAKRATLINNTQNLATKARSVLNTNISGYKKNQLASLYNTFGLALGRNNISPNTKKLVEQALNKVGPLVNVKYGKPGLAPAAPSPTPSKTANAARRMLARSNANINSMGGNNYARGRQQIFRNRLQRQNAPLTNANRKNLTNAINRINKYLTRVKPQAPGGSSTVNTARKWLAVQNLSGVNTTLVNQAYKGLSRAFGSRPFSNENQQVIMGAINKLGRNLNRRRGGAL